MMRTIIFLLLLSTFHITVSQTKMDIDIQKAKSKVFDIKTQEVQTIFNNASKNAHSVEQNDGINLTYALILNTDTGNAYTILCKYEYYGDNQSMLKALKNKLLLLSSDSLIQNNFLNYKSIEQNVLKNKYIQFNNGNLCMIELNAHKETNTELLPLYIQKIKEITTQLILFDRNATRLNINNKGNIFWDFLGSY